LPTQDNKGRGDFTGGIIYPTVAIDGGYISGSDNWKHDAGKVCFSRTIDPEKYPVNPKVILQK
jgi:hypothetical protein